METRFKHAFVMNVMSSDHPGIVAAVGRAVSSRGGNIDSLSQTVLKGYFTLIMMISFDGPIDPAELADAVRQAEKGFHVAVTPYDPAVVPAGSPHECFVITAFGEDRNDIVLSFSQYMAGKDINIVDLFGERRGDNFLLVCQLEVPPRWDIFHLQAELEEMGRELGFTVRLQHENIFVATNQLRLSRHQS